MSDTIMQAPPIVDLNKNREYQYTKYDYLDAWGVPEYNPKFDFQHDENFTLEVENFTLEDGDEYNEDIIKRNRPLSTSKIPDNLSSLYLDSDTKIPSRENCKSVCDVLPDNYKTVDLVKFISEVKGENKKLEEKKNKLQKQQERANTIAEEAIAAAEERKKETEKKINEEIAATKERKKETEKKNK